MGTVPNAVFERMLEAIGEGQSAAVMEELNRLLNAGNSPSQMARQLVRYLRNCLMAKLGGERPSCCRSPATSAPAPCARPLLFSEEDLTRFLQIMLRTLRRAELPSGAALPPGAGPAEAGPPAAPVAAGGNS